MSHDCLFCRISREEIPAHVIHQDSRLLAFLDIHPVRPGHVLIIPRQHYPYFEDMPADLAGHILNLGQRLARHMKRLYSVERVGFAFTGIHVAHAHAHLIPMHHPQDVTSTQYIEQKDLTFVMPPQSPPEQLASVAQDLRAPQKARAGPKTRPCRFPRCRIYSASLSASNASTSGRSTSSMKAMGALSP
ncbi:histidine triad protein [Bordetella pertussis]|nr:histidine triad protein [Bordetella pertussis]CFN86869.1 histidine triad protein [Bordetella pertussis]CFW05269.1 histidine triad protein [Bordetella pertussis]CPO26929.1 histidine triad protein [Bordetella pertussis]